MVDDSVQPIEADHVGANAIYQSRCRAFLHLYLRSNDLQYIDTSLLDDTGANISDITSQVLFWVKATWTVAGLGSLSIGSHRCDRQATRDMYNMWMHRLVELISF
jgi:hypothetical protein